MGDNALGRFLRARRDATTPASVGLPHGPRRRAPGLRRGELAERAGISVEYLTRLERGSDRYPSGQVLGSLADALALTADERVHLYRLIKADSGAQCQTASTAPVLRPAVRALLDRLGTTPAFVTAPAGDALACTDGFRSLAGPAGLLDGERPNLARYVFADPRSRAAFPDWPEIADQRAAALRAAALRAAADLGDLAAGALAVELSITAGTEFGDRYAAAATLPAQTGVERWAVPSGTQRLAYETLALSGSEEHRIVVYLPA